MFFKRLAVGVIALLCIHPLVSTLPTHNKLETRNYNDKSEKYDSKLERFSRETSETVLSSTTTSQVPPHLEHEETSSSAPDDPDGSTVGIQSMMPTKETRSSTCKTLREILEEVFSVPRTQMHWDWSYNSFVLVDLFFSGLLEEEKLNRYHSTQSDRTRIDSEGYCKILLNDHKPTSGRNGTCSWHYKCVQDLNEFPSFKIEAELDHQSSSERRTCNQVKRRRTVFKRTDCPDSDHENWILEATNIVVGFVESNTQK